MGRRNRLLRFASGAAAAEVTIYAGPVAGGAVLGVGNDLTTQLGQKSRGEIESINWGQTTFSGFMGGATAYVGGQITGFVSPYVSGLTSKIASPVIQQSLTQGVTNATSGFVLGTGVSLFNGNDWRTALGDGGRGALFGGGLGLMTGTISGYNYAKANNLDPWSGQAKFSSTVRTDPVSLSEQLTLKEAQSGQGDQIMAGKINAPQWKGWQKIEYSHRLPNGEFITIHYWKNPLTNALTGFKFKTPPH